MYQSHGWYGDSFHLFKCNVGDMKFKWKTLDDQKKWFMISLQWGVPTFMIFFLLIMRNPQQSSRRTFEHDAVIQVGTNSIWAGPPCDKKSMGIQEARGPRRGLALTCLNGLWSPPWSLNENLISLGGSLGWGYPKIPMKTDVAKNPNLDDFFKSCLLRLNSFTRKTQK